MKCSRFGRIFFHLSGNSVMDIKVQQYYYDCFKLTNIVTKLFFKQIVCIDFIDPCNYRHFNKVEMRYDHNFKFFWMFGGYGWHKRRTKDRQTS